MSDLEDTDDHILSDEIKLKNFKENKEAEEIFNFEIAFKINESAEPCKRPCKDNSLTEKNFKLISSKEHNQLVLKTNFVRTDRHSCLIDLKNLKQILLNDMFLNKIHIGYLIELETIADPYYVSGMHLLVKDTNGDIENLVLFNYESKFQDILPKMIIPTGTKLIVKEPHLQLFDHSDFGIRVDSPTNIIIKSYPEYELKKSVDEFINEGIRLLTRSQYHVAIRYFTKAIEKSNKKSAKAYFNRAQSFIKLEKHYSALQDAKQAASLEKNNSKAFFSIGKSAYFLKKFEVALEGFQTCLKLDPKNKEAEFELKKTKERINESKNGTYNLEALYEQFFKKTDLFMDIADFKSNKITIKDIENKSKGVVATDFIKKGTLLLAAKASSAVFYNRNDYRRKSYNTVHSIDNGFNSRNETENIANLVHKMIDDPDFANDIYSLYAGPNFTRDKVEHPLIDIQRIEAIYSFNSFQIKNSYQVLDMIELEREFKNLENYNEEDFNELDLTAIDFESAEYKFLAQMQVKYDNLSKQSGLWFMSSMFNHSCASNAIMQTLGDMMMFYSIKDIQQDEEVTISYFPPELDFKLKIERSLDVYGFKCDCKLCEMDEKDPMRIVRENYQNEIDFKHSFRMVGINESMRDLQKMKQTYFNREEARYQLMNPLKILAIKYRINSDYNHSAECFEEAFEIIKDYNDFGAITMLKESFADYKKSLQIEKAELIKKKAFEYFESISLNKIYYEKIWEKNVSIIEI